MKRTVADVLADMHEHHLRRTPDLATGLDVFSCTDPTCPLVVAPKDDYRPVGHAGMHSWS